MIPKDLKILLIAGFVTIFFWPIGAFIWQTWEVWLGLIIVGVSFYLYKFIQFYREENKKLRQKK